MELTVKEKRTIYAKQYYIKNIEKERQYTLINKERIKQYNKEYYIKNKQEVDIKNKQWYDKNRKSTRNYHNKYVFNRKKTDPNFKILFNMRSRIYNVIKFNYNSPSTIKLLGCSIEFLKGWLEGQFVEGMAWDNYGKGGWVIDHIWPCANFDLTDIKQQKQCFNYKNLQPLWEIDNLKKGRKIQSS